MFRTLNCVSFFGCVFIINKIKIIEVIKRTNKILDKSVVDLEREIKKTYNSDNNVNDYASNKVDFF